MPSVRGIVVKGRWSTVVIAGVSDTYSGSGSGFGSATRPHQVMLTRD